MSVYLIVTLYVVMNVVKFVKALFTTMPRRGYKQRFVSKLSLNIRTFLPKPHFLGRTLLEFPLLGELFLYGNNVPDDKLAGKDFREPHIHFLKKSFELLETLSTKPIEDKNMYRAYLQAYSGFAFFYSLKQGYYYNGFHNRNAFFEEPWYIEQNQKELEWYLKFEKLFDNPQIQKIYGKQLAKSKVLLYCAILNITMKTYVRVRNLLVGEDANKAPLFRASKFQELKQLNAAQGERGGVLFELSNQEIETLYNSYIRHTGMYKHIGKKVCGYEVYGNVYESPDHTGKKMQTNRGQMIINVF